MDETTINIIFQIFSKNNPVPKTELDYVNNFTLSVAVVLSAQSTDKSVNKATKDLFKEYNSPDQMLALGEERLKQYIKTIGLYNIKAKNIIALCKLLINKYNATIPSKFDELITLPGIGRKTANVILNCAFGKKTMAVDTHVHRVSNRLGLSSGQTPSAVEQDLLEQIPDQWLNNAHHWLILHGRYICKARNPICVTCPVQTYCKYYRENYVQSLSRN